MAVIIVALLVSFSLVCISALLLRWNELKYRNKSLPPGTMGWPVVGETTEFLKQGPQFMKNQRSRYGSFFKSHILGCPTIVCMDPEVNRHILMNESKGFIPGYPESMLHILGRRNMAAVHGAAHKRMRGALLHLISPQMIRNHLLPTIDCFMRAHLTHWEDQTVDIQLKTKEMALLSALQQVAGVDSGAISQSFVPEFFKLVLGTLSLPIDFPGTNYRQGFQGRKNVVRILEQLIQQRRDSKDVHVDMLGYLMNKESRYKLTDEEIIDQIITVLYSGYETISTTSMMAVKYLHDNPKALEELRREHFAIRSNKKPEDPIDLDDVKSMRFTRAVIFEASRLATIVNGVLRKTTRDIELNGFTIPKDWRIYVYTRESNYNSSLFPDPLCFNPWRWLERNLEIQNHVFIFGGGTRQCPGKELGVSEISTFLHYFVTKYRWEEMGGDKLMEFPRVEAPNGLHIKVSSYC